MAQKAGGGMEDKAVRRLEGIINSMTLLERTKPEIIKANRKRRIATGSGSSVQEVNQLLDQFQQMQKMMKQLRNPRARQNLMNMFGGFR
jgi:signal recognition particle subunit SRP54